MANYSVNVTDNGDGTWILSTVLRAPTTVASGGTDLFGGNSTSSPFSQFRDAVSPPYEARLGGLGQAMRNPGEALGRAITLIALDRAING